MIEMLNQDLYLHFEKDLILTLTPLYKEEFLDNYIDAKSCFCNLEYVEEMDSSGFQFLISLIKTCEANQIDFRVNRISPFAKKMIQDFNLPQHFRMKLLGE